MSAAATTLLKRALGRTGLEVTELGFGGWAIGGNEHGNSLGPTDDAASRAAIDAALESGIALFDTADVYGFGRSERLIGEALAAAGCRERVVIATKAGSDFTDPKAMKRTYGGEYLRAALCRSLERLRTDRVDVFQLHDPPADVIRSPETHAALRRIREEKLARAVGVTFHTLDEGNAALESDVYETIQITYNVAAQWVATRLFGKARAKGVGVIAREPLAQGYLSGKYGPDHAFVPGDVRASWPPNHRLYLADTARRMREYFHGRQKLDRPLAAIALQFALAEEAVASVLVSMKTVEQVRDNVAARALPPLARKHLAWLRE